MTVGRRTVKLPGMPAFNADDPAYRILNFDDWFSTGVPNAVLVANGGAAGSIPSGEWLPVEAYLNLTGYIDPSDRSQLGDARRALLTAIPPDRDVPLIVYGNDLDVDQQLWVRRYDKVTATIRQRLDFTLPLVAKDPYKYALVPLVAGMGMFVTEKWLREYAQPGGTGAWLREYAQPSGVTTDPWTREYSQYVPDGPYPSTLIATSRGTATSRRIVFSLAGPLTKGQWFLDAPRTGGQLRVKVSVTNTQRLVIDCFNYTATLDGIDVTHLVYGDWLTFEAGANTYRLIGGVKRSAAFATVTAYPAFE